MTFQKKIAVLGSTGSIGTQCLEIVEQHPENFDVQIISGNTNFQLLAEQYEKFKPSYIIIENEDCFNEFKSQYFNYDTKLILGLDQLKECISHIHLELIVNALPSVHGLIPSAVSLESGIDLALANKESMLIAGVYLKNLALKYDSKIIPVDSEISTIFQCLKGEHKGEVRKIWLTASGGPLYSRKDLNLKEIRIETILNHPSWTMGQKISVDSATMVNKAFEVFEIHQFFDFSIENIDVIIHPESHVHSLVEFIDGNIKALVGVPDMKVHILHALSHPHRMDGKNADVHFKPGSWIFELFKEGDHPHFTFAMDCLMKGGNFPAAFVMCNDFFVHAFLDNKIEFQNIYNLTKDSMKSVRYNETPTFLELEATILDMKQICEKVMLKSFSTLA